MTVRKSLVEKNSDVCKHHCFETNYIYLWLVFFCFKLSILLSELVVVFVSKIVVKTVSKFVLKSTQKKT